MPWQGGRVRYRLLLLVLALALMTALVAGCGPAQTQAPKPTSSSVNMLSGAPFGYRFFRETPESGARYEVVPREAVRVTEMFRRYADDGAAIADLGRWLTGQGRAPAPGRSGGIAA